MSVSNRPFSGFFKWIIPQRIAVKLALVICVLVFVLVSVLSISLIHVTQSLLKDTVKNNHHEVAVRAAREISLFVTRPVELLAIAGKLIGRTQVGPWDQETVLVEMSLDFPMFEEIVSVDTKGTEIASSNPGYPKRNRAREESFQSAMEGGHFFSSISVGDDYLPHVTISLPIYKLGKVAGVLIAEVNLRGMWDIVDGIRIGETGRAFLISENGLLIAHPDKKLVLRNMDLSSHPVFESPDSARSESVEYDEGGKRFLASHAPVQGPLSFITVIQMEVQEAYQLVDEMRLLILLVLLISLMLSIAVSFFMARWLTRPVKALQHWSKRVALGDFDYSLSPKSSDEIGRLFIMFKRMSERLKAAREKEHLAALGEAATTISHKLKNSIVSLKTFAQLLPQRKRDEHFMRRFESHFSSMVDYLEKMFKNLSQVASSRTPKIEWVDLPLIFQSVYNNHSEIIERQGIDFRSEVAREFPVIQGDREQLQELVVNLVQNSIQAMPNGGGLTLNALHSPDSSCIRIALNDEGTGIPPKHIEKIFKPFFTTKPAGMGLGLAIVKKIVEDHKGTISVTNKESGGTIFTVRLPIAQSKKVTIELPQELTSIKS